jgi:hypothetical protein
MRDPDRSQGSVLIPTRVYEPTEKAPAGCLGLPLTPNAKRRARAFQSEYLSLLRLNRTRIDAADRGSIGAPKPPPEIQEPWVVDREQLT